MFQIEFFSQGKTSESNDDNWVISPTMFAVIDGATSKSSILVDTLSSGKYASLILTNALREIDNSITGKNLVPELSIRFENALKLSDFKDNTGNRPNAKFACVQLIQDNIIITRVGDVGVRLNEKDIAIDSNPIDPIHAKLRIEAIQKKAIENPEMPLRDLLVLGRKTIETSLIMQTHTFQNNSTHPFGFGAIDGHPVPEKFISVNTYPRGEVRTIELFTDGYFRIPETATIEAWENSFREVEEEDPYKIHLYPSTKGSTETSFTDDRTILIARAKR